MESLRAGARPRRRSGGLHAPLRPRAVRRAGPRGRRRRALDEPLRLRRRVTAARRRHSVRAFGHEAFYRRAPERRLARAADGAARPARARPAALPARSGARPTSCTSSGCRCRRSTAALLPPRRPRLLTAHDVLPREAGARPARRPAARSTSAWTRSIVHSEHGAARLRDELPARARQGPRDPARRVPRPRRSDPRRCRPSAARPSGRPGHAHAGPIVLCFGLMRPVQGPRRAARGLAARGPARRRASCGSSGDRAWTSPSCARPRRRACAGSRASSRTPSSRRCSARPISSCSRTARSTSPGCCSRRWRSARRCC